MIDLIINKYMFEKNKNKKSNISVETLSIIYNSTCESLELPVV